MQTESLAETAWASIAMRISVMTVSRAGLLSACLICVSLLAACGGDDSAMFNNGVTTPAPTLPAPVTQFSLNVSVLGNGSVTSLPAGIECGSDCNHSYDRGTSVTLTASAVNGYTFSGWSGACSGSNPACTISMTANLSARAMFTVIGAAAGTPVILYSDLDSGPNSGGQDNHGVFVTISGKHFGATRGSGIVTVGGGAVNNYPLWSDTKIIVQLGAAASSGNIVVTNATAQSSNGIPFTVRPGRIFFVTPTGTGNGSFVSPMSPFAIHSNIQPGDSYYFRAGTYSGAYGDTTWQATNFTLGSGQRGARGNPLALVGYPNEVVTFVAGERTNIGFSTSSGVGAYTTIANLTLVGADGCVSGGGFYTPAKSGAPGVRVINNVCSATYTGNTMSGMLVIQNDGWRVWGNEFKDTGTSPPINNNHAVYIQDAASDVDVGWNLFQNLRMGHVIQLHTDAVPGGASCYTSTDVRIHDNVITANQVDDSRGINVGNTCADSYGAIYNNILYNLGQRFSAIVTYTGSWKIYNNTLYNIHSDPMLWISGQATAEVKNNIFYSDGTSRYVGVANGAAMSQLTLSNNLYYNGGAAPSQDPAAISGNPLFMDPAGGDFHLQSGSPAIDTGSASVNTVVSVDHDGISRPQGSGYDVGAYER